MPNSYQQLEEKFQRIAQLDHAATFLQWDQSVIMPPGGNEHRANSIAEIATIEHEILCDPALEELLNDAEEKETNPQRKISIEEMKRTWQQAICLPAELVKAKSLAGSRCEHGWRTQRKENDWHGFLKNFKEVVVLSKEEAQARQSFSGDRFQTPYDAMLDLYCTGDSSDFIEDVFSTLKKKLPNLIHTIVERQAHRNIDINGSFPTEKQLQLSHQLMAHLGFDFDCGRLDVSLHPFSTGDRGDQRITTRFRDSDFIDALSATAHETGHASYENGLPEDLDGLPVGQARNMCIHESQSLLFEKQIFLSQPFISFFTPIIHKTLPETSTFSTDMIWSSCTKVEQSFIRVEADEVTYPLHVILRFEIERGLINGTIGPDDIPELWDDKMRHYLDISTAGNFSDGCMQDIHWTDGSFGYFPSYTLGALNAAQLFAAIKNQHPDWRERLQNGDISFIRQWLGEHIWSKGSTMSSQDLIFKATGESTNPNHFIEHLQNRYLESAY